MRPIYLEYLLFCGLSLCVANNARSFNISGHYIISWTLVLFKEDDIYCAAYVWCISCILLLFKHDCSPNVLPFSFLELETTAVKMTQMFCENLPLSKELDAQESMYGEDLLSMACNLLVQVCIFPYGIIVLFHYVLLQSQLCVTRKPSGTAFDFCKCLTNRKINIK